MKNKRLQILTKLILSLTSIIFLCSWGIWGHKHINKAAVFALPDSMRVFFFNHIDFITEESVVPDIRKYTMKDKTEAPRHFIDMESFGNMDSIPMSMKDYEAKYEKDFLQKNGILPWHIQVMMEKLTKAFRDKDKAAILFLAADLGHYLGDAHMPLHTSLNHDGQLTDQKGIHAFWEAQLPEMFGSNYNFYTGNVKYITDLTKETWRIINSSHQLADTLLATERNLKAGFQADKIYMKDNKETISKTKFNQSIHSAEYAEQYHKLLNGMVEKQLRASIAATADYWYTAWVDAGKPDLASLDDAGLTERNKKSLDEDYNAWKNGKITLLKIQNEF